MGMVPNLVTGVWVGGEDRAAHFLIRLMVKELQWHYQYGQFICEDVMKMKTLKISKKNFKKPEEIID